MDRKLRLSNTRSTGWRPWIRGLALGLTVAAASLALGTAAPTSAVAQVSGTSMSVPLAPDAPSQYVVKKGDTLWDIAGVFLRDPWYWPEIWYVNPQVANPHLIYPGDVLNLVYVDGKPRITIGTAGAERLSPRVLSEPLAGAIRTIPYDLLMDFVGRPGLLTRNEARKAPSVVGMRDRHIVGSDQNEVYGRGLDNPAAGTRYTIVNVGDELRDPDDGDLLGYIGHYAGTGEVIQNTGAVVPGESSIFKMRREEDFTHLRIVESGREILQGDRLFPAQVDVGDDFRLSAPKNEELLGQVIAVVDGVYVAGRYQVVALNRGKQHGLEPGHVLSVWQRGEKVKDRGPSTDNWTKELTKPFARKVRLPNERAGLMMVFRAYDRISYALVMRATSEMHVQDIVRNP